MSEEKKRDNDLPMVLPGVDIVHYATTGEFEIEIGALTSDQASQVRPVMQKFHREFENQLRLVASYFVTCALYNNKVTIVVGAQSCHRLDLPTVYDDYPVLACDNRVELATRQRVLSDIYSAKLQVGSGIGRKDDYDNFGTLGGFVKIGDQIKAMTCHHVIKNGCEFSQPSYSSVADLRCQTTLASRIAELEQDFSAGSSSANLGVDEIVDHCRYDYQLLRIHESRVPDQPMNRIEWGDDQVTIKPPVYDLNDQETAAKIVERDLRFGKCGAASGQTFGTLLNSCRSDCIIRTEGCDTYTTEFAFKAMFDQEFAETGDSGAWVYACDQRDKELTLVGVVSAVSHEPPYLTFVTPISDIVRHFKSRTGLDLTFLD